MSRILADRYELLEVVGAGGVACVHRAHDRHLARDVAVKVLDDTLAQSADPSGRDRFLREARSAARLDHPHLVTVYDAGEDRGELFLVMELVDGQSLAALVAQRGPLAVDQAVSIAVQILDGLAAVHAKGVIHRDVKPSNVLVDTQGRVRLTDFGIAKRLDDIEDALTSAGMVIGTPSYLAPEQAHGGELGPATDIYLVGLVLYEMLTGSRPAGDARDPRAIRRDVPEAVAGVVARALDPDPAQRFATAEAMIDALRDAPRDRRQDDVDRSSTLAFPVPVPLATSLMTPETTPLTVTPVTPGDQPPERRWWLLGIVAATILLLGLALLASRSGRQDPAQSPVSTVAGTTPASTAPLPSIEVPPSQPVPSTAVAAAEDGPGVNPGPGPGAGPDKPKGKDKKGGGDG